MACISRKIGGQKEMNDINISWQKMLRRVTFYYVASDEVLDNRDDYLTKLKKLRNYFSEILTILKKAIKILKAMTVNSDVIL
jgi:hypothetical protein